NGPGHNRIELTTPRQGDGFFERSCRRTGRFELRFARRALRVFADHDVFRGRQQFRFERRANNLGADAGTVSESDADAKRHWVLSRNLRLCAILWKPTAFRVRATTATQAMSPCNAHVSDQKRSMSNIEHRTLKSSDERL